MKYTLWKKEGDLWRIRACKNFGDVKKGDVGGLVLSEKNLSQDGNCWVYDSAKVYDNAKVSGNAKISGTAWVSGDAKVFGDAHVYGDAWVHGDAWVDYDVSDGEVKA